MTITNPYAIFANRTDAHEWAKRLASNPATALVDTETTGLGTDAEVIELAVVSIDGTVLLNTLIHPTGHIPIDATRVHQLTIDDFDGAPFWDEINNQISSVLHGRPIVIFNASYDERLINQTCARALVPPMIHDYSCACEAVAAYVGEPGREWKGERFRRLSLEHAAKRFGIVPGGHRALRDAEATRQLVIKMSEAA